MAPLLVERERPTFCRACFEGAVESAALACGAEQDEERVGERGEKEQSIATARGALGLSVVAASCGVAAG